MQPVLTVAEMQAVDARAQSSISLDVLVERAGTAVAGAALDLMGGAYGRRVVVVAGKGNNGADGRVAASVLERRGARVEVIDVSEAPPRIGPADLVIDAAFGTGFRGEYRAPTVASGTPVLAVDIPSGIDGDSGVASGSPLAAARTVTFAALKPGLVQADGPALAGWVTVADIGLPVEGARVQAMTDGDIDDLLPARPRNAHKWMSAVLVVAGSPGMTGAAAMCAMAAYRAGAGMVRLGIPGADVGQTPASEAVSVPLPKAGWADEALTQAERCRVVVVGPGIGRDESTATDLRRLVARSPVPVVVDADGLYALGHVEAPLASASTVVLTPHDGEYQRLAGRAPGSDRIVAARQLAEASGAVALVKGTTTAVADPGGRVVLGLAGTPALATAGTGDVLSGVIAAFVARGVAPLEAAGLAAHVHGRAAADGAAEGLVAGDLPGLVSDVLSRSRAASAGPAAPPSRSSVRRG
ncbi:MAG: ADP-dependent NAD(P)H-hydrate dehydratase / NAD(P)H-hydrate epimerase [Acidimicrobiaceae bacterium]|nr:ADP-dependent NAD(P)H-hydrate dehydratase / NAD(P)H-hydrate epimerase [Acidimicrobiaceae bacterium]